MCFIYARTTSCRLAQLQRLGSRTFGSVFFFSLLNSCFISLRQHKEPKFPDDALMIISQPPPDDDALEHFWNSQVKELALPGASSEEMSRQRPDLMALCEGHEHQNAAACFLSRSFVEVMSAARIALFSKKVADSNKHFCLGESS